MSSPSKKPLTDSIKTSIDASNTRRDVIVPEDLNQALQNIGMRVRKSVMEGYNTDRVPTFTVPTTPNCSPAKLPTTQSTPTTIFRTANDALNSVFPMGSPRIPLTPSPKKRTRPDVGSDTETSRNLDGDMEMDEVEPDSDDDPVMVILGPDANATAFTPPRKIKPLRARRGAAQSEGNFSDPFTFTGQASSVHAPSLFATSAGDMHENMDLDPSEERREATAP